MSNPYRRNLSLAGINVAALDVEALKSLARQLLDNQIHGICFSAYVEGQEPGDVLGEAQIRERLAIVEKHVKWVRTFSCTEGNELIPAIAAERGLRTMVGVWLSDDLEKNELEIANAIRVGQAGHGDIFGVGNEVLLREELTEAQLIDYIERVKTALPNAEVGYVDAYFKFVDYPAVTAACDVILSNCYPFWEGCPAEHALLYMKEMYRRAQRAAGGKRVIVSETGWPNLGEAERGAVPGYENALKYFIDTCQWAEEDGIEVFYFSSFDEAWKVADEGDVGAYWGLWDSDGNPKYM